MATAPNSTRENRMFFLSDPIFYVCIAACLTVIYLSALAGSGRDSGINESF
jgi:hypothetical protein